MPASQSVSSQEIAHSLTAHYFDGVSVFERRMRIEFIEHCVPIWMAFGSVFPPRMMTLAEYGEVGELIQIQL
jgi:hypothetical protein